MLVDFSQSMMLVNGQRLLSTLINGCWSIDVGWFMAGTRQSMLMFLGQMLVNQC